jgi:hypothetical protein
MFIGIERAGVYDPGPVVPELKKLRVSVGASAAALA